MQQNLFLENRETDQENKKTVNVASIPQRSLFRYPGGKTWFVPTFRKWLKSKHKKPSLLIEPFAGGGIISLTAIFENMADKALLVELDEQVAAVWQSLVDGHANWLINKILNFELNLNNLSSELNKSHSDVRNKAFQTILKNRTYHGGILAAGSGLVKYGENGKGLLSRWYPLTLAKRIKAINYIKNKLLFLQGDGMDVMSKYSPKSDVAYFIDPPYTAGGKRAGARLYRHYDIDHEHLFALCKTLKGDFILTYDNAEEVKALAYKYGFKAKPISMKNTHHAEMTELVIGKDLSWL
ncbi:MAG: DNA adenine methylase [Candidatus Margulisbacteria bacterium]|nr:DNA adenine methylase [Candidatus Margulisiibacteriota bacterium]MBU1617052.1 DNA adenine methylase [Candidatus Margulisiibacteriota bacterium]